MQDNLSFRDFLESLNAAGRAGQHVWKPETPPIHGTDLSQNPSANPLPKTKLKSVNIDKGFRPLPPAPFKGLSGEDFGIKFKRVHTPKI